ncbi:MAG: hypothetical protein IE916_01430 [Epsilonproteobacteria bacterium]|nr:hypothetical protein [Campylobacterota bacterium]
MRRENRSIKSRFTALENQLLNTFFSGVYISANEIISIGKKVDLELDMNSRELLIKELLNKSDANGKLQECAGLLDALLQERVHQYHMLSRDYNGAASELAALATKTNATRTLLKRESQGNTYEH